MSCNDDIFIPADIKTLETTGKSVIIHRGMDIFRTEPWVRKTKIHTGNLSRETPKNKIRDCGDNKFMINYTEQ